MNVLLICYGYCGDIKLKLSVFREVTGFSKIGGHCKALDDGTCRQCVLLP